MNNLDEIEVGKLVRNYTKDTLMDEEYVDDVMRRITQLNEEDLGDSVEDNYMKQMPGIKSLNILGTDYKVVYMSSKYHEYGTSLFLVKSELMEGLVSKQEISSIIDREIGNNVYKLEGAEY